MEESPDYWRQSHPWVGDLRCYKKVGWARHGSKPASNILWLLLEFLLWLPSVDHALGYISQINHFLQRYFWSCFITVIKILAKYDGQLFQETYSWPEMLTHNYPQMKSLHEKPNHCFISGRDFIQTYFLFWFRWDNKVIWWQFTNS